MATYDNGLAATHYGPCKVSALVADRVPVEIDCMTDYPFTDRIDLRVNPARAASFSLKFRIPGWCQRPSLSVNDVSLEVAPDAAGFARVERFWNPGDRVRLQLPMSASVQSGRDRNAGNAPYASVSYGPLLFALPIPDADGGNTPDPTARWNFALDTRQPGLTIERSAMPARWDWPLAAPLKMRVNAIEVPWKLDAQAPQLPLLPAAAAKPSQPLTLVPYGCAKFRISMFPVAAEPGTQPGPNRP